MSAKLNQPVGQKLLTNVAIVRMKKGGERFEIACYPNKVMPWREGIEKDLSEVLQIEAVYTNVTSGKIANRKQLDKAFGAGVEQNDIVMEILKKGQLQTTQAERHKQSESMSRDIATIVADKCVNSDTKRPFTVAIIETAMRDIHYNLHPTRSAKQQALTVIALLKGTIPIARAQMRLHITIPEKSAAKLKEKLKELFSSVELEEWSGDFEITGLIDPGRFRSVEELVSNETKGKARVEVVDFSVIQEGAARIVDETRRTDADAAKKDDNDDSDDESGAEDDNDDDEPKKPAAAAAKKVTNGKGSNKSNDNDNDDEEESDEKREKPAPAAKRNGGNSKSKLPPPAPEDLGVLRARKQDRQKQRRSAQDRKRAGGDDDDRLPNEDDISL